MKITRMMQIIITIRIINDNNNNQNNKRNNKYSNDDKNENQININHDINDKSN